MFDDVRQTWTKQFIYVIRLDKTLTAAAGPFSYPKPTTEFPIKTREKIYKQNDNIFENIHVASDCQSRDSWLSSAWNIVS